MKTKNYSIVSYFTGDDFEFIRNIQKELSVLTGSKKSLIDWSPHITVGDAITIPDEKIFQIENILNKIASEKKVFNISVSGFGGTDSWRGAIKDVITPYVIWLDVEINNNLEDLFNSIRDSITSNEETWLPRTVEYKPHITLAFVDLDKEGHEKGLEYLRTREVIREFSISSISLVECFGEGNMESKEVKRFDFGK